MSIPPWLLAFVGTALVMRWRWFIPLIFSDRKRRKLCDWALANVNRAKLLCYRVMWQESLDQKRDQGIVFVFPEKCFDSPDREMSMVNYLFGEEPSEKEVAQFGAAAIKRAAVDWLNGHHNFVELVIQSLKVQMIATEGLGGIDRNQRSFRFPDFLQYHENYPKNLDPHAYAALVSRMTSQTPGAMPAFQTLQEYESYRKERLKELGP